MQSMLDGLGQRLGDGSLAVSLALTAMLFGPVFVTVSRLYAWLGVPARTRLSMALASGVTITATVLVFLATPPHIDAHAARELPPLVMSLSEATPDAKVVPPPKPLPPETVVSESSHERARPQASVKKSSYAKPPSNALRRYLAQQPRLRGAGSGAVALSGIGVASEGGGGGGGSGAIALSNDMEFASNIDDAMAFAHYQRSRHEIVSARSRAFQPARTLDARAAGGGGTPAQKIHTPRPKYPSDARKGNIEGFVVVRVLISRTGDVQEFEIISAQPAGVFEQCVEETLPQWRFAPAKDRDGRPIESQRQFNLVFKMEDA